MRFKNTFERRELSRLAEGIALLFLGVILGTLFLRTGLFEFELKFNLLNMLTILLTFVVTFQLQHALVHRASDDRVEKQIIISQLQDAEKTLRQIGNVVRASALGESKLEEGRAVLTEFRLLSNQIAATGRLFGLTPIKPDSSKIAELQRSYLTLKQITTGGRFPSSGPLGRDEHRKVQERIANLSEEIFRVIFYVNRL
jgi:hypothetical protein